MNYLYQNDHKNTAHPFNLVLKNENSIVNHGKNNNDLTHQNVLAIISQLYLFNYSTQFGEINILSKKNSFGVFKEIIGCFS